jgi:multidrug efflux system membrane fusion protein
MTVPTPSSAARSLARQLLLAALLVPLASGCRRPATAPPPPPTPTVSVLEPVEHPVQDYLEYNGYLDAVESVQVRARVQGFLEEIRFKEGQDVKKNDVLFKIDPREAAASLKKAEADKAKAAAEVTNARSEEARAKRLVQNRTISDEEYQSKLAAKESAEATIRQAEAAIETAQIQLGYTEIKSPIDGKISRTMVTRGNLVGMNEQTLLTNIVSVDPLFVYFDIPERDLVSFTRDERTQKSNPRESPIEVGIATEDGYPHVGKLDFQDNRVETETGTVRLRGRIPNPTVPPNNIRLLYPGLFAKVRMPIGKAEAKLTIPEDALLTGQEGRFVYVLGKDNVIEKRTVVPGPIVWRMPVNGSNDPRWTLEGPPKKEAAPPVADAQGSPGKKDAAPGKGPPTKTQLPPPVLRSVISIKKGLKPGERIVFNGIQRVRPGAPVVPEDWKMKKPTVTAPRADAQGSPKDGKKS